MRLPKIIFSTDQMDVMNDNGVQISAPTRKIDCGMAKTVYVRMLAGPARTTRNVFGTSHSFNFGQQPKLMSSPRQTGFLEKMGSAALPGSRGWLKSELKQQTLVVVMERTISLATVRCFRYDKVSFSHAGGMSPLSWRLPYICLFTCSSECSSSIFERSKKR